ncbi:hypothetical protein [Clostridium estertheticum]|uniref:hypothetical protein n=1 Tax=Clostridium estertheticum TaxID=238834 RepID=UPI001C0BF701|nr:hypothetical protein [Clostridium estertheticum]MBU3199602.1 hypothetical protein [Clostridium estertheticum]
MSWKSYGNFTFAKEELLNGNLIIISSLVASHSGEISYFITPRSSMILIGGSL